VLDGNFAQGPMSNLRKAAKFGALWQVSAMRWRALLCHRARTIPIRNLPHSWRVSRPCPKLDAAALTAEALRPARGINSRLAKAGVRKTHELRLSRRSQAHDFPFRH